jgi:hypothetical protein
MTSAWVAFCILLLLAVVAVATMRKHWYLGLFLGLFAISVPISAATGISLFSLFTISVLVAVMAWAITVDWGQFALLFGTLALFLVVKLIEPDIHPVIQLFFWIFWIAGLIWAMASNPSRGFTVALGVFGIAFLLVMINIPLAMSSSRDQSVEAAQFLTVQRDENGPVQNLAFVSNTKTTSPDNPVVGEETVNTTNLQPSVDDGKGPVTSWTNLVERVNALPKDKKQAYIEAINQRSKQLGSWEQVEQYAALEKNGKLGDTRVILVLNSNLSDQQVRNEVRPYIGDAADKLLIVRAHGALINTRGVDSGQIEDFADNRSQVRVILAVPVKQKSGGYVADKEGKGVERGYGILTECTNPSTGIVQNPNPKPYIPTPSTSKTPTKQTSTPPSKTPPPSSPPTTTPPTSGPPTSTPPTSNPPTSTPPTTPPTSTPPTSTPPTSTPPTTPPTSTPPTSTPPTSNPPTSTPPTSKGPVIVPTGKPTVNPPPAEDKETVKPTYTQPADPTTRPGDEVTDVPAPGATKEPTRNVPTKDPTVAPEPTDPGTGDVDPDLVSMTTSTGGSSSLALLAAFGLVLYALFSRRPMKRRK